MPAKDMNEGRRVRIQHPENPGTYLEVTPEAYHKTPVRDEKTYEQLGWKILRWDDGLPYDRALSREIKAELKAKEEPKEEPKAKAVEQAPARPRTNDPESGGLTRAEVTAPRVTTSSTFEGGSKK